MNFHRIAYSGKRSGVTSTYDSLLQPHVKNGTNLDQRQNDLLPDTAVCLEGIKLK